MITDLEEQLQEASQAYDEAIRAFAREQSEVMSALDKAKEAVAHYRKTSSHPYLNSANRDEQAKAIDARYWANAAMLNACDRLISQLEKGINK